MQEIVYVKSKDSITKYYPFASISKILPGFQDDELIMDLNAQKPVKITMLYIQQRNFVIEILKLACTTGVEHSKKDQVNNPHNINFKETLRSLKLLNPPSTSIE